MRWVVPLLAFLFLWSPSATAQSATDRVYIGGRVTAGARLDDRPGDRSTTSAEVSVASPMLPLGERDLLRLGLAYRHDRITLDAPNETRRFPLHAFSPNVTWAHVLGRRWSLSLTALPTIASDLRRPFSFDDVQINGLAGLTYLVGGDPGFRITFAVLGQSRALFTPVLPFVSLDYRTRHLAISAGISGTHVLGLLGDRAELGIFGNIGGGVFRVRAPDPRVRFTRLLDLGFGPEANVRLFGPVWLEAKAGYNVLQTGKLTDADLDRIPGTSLDSRGAFFGQLGIGVR